MRVEVGSRAVSGVARKSEAGGCLTIESVTFGGACSPDERSDIRGGVQVSLRMSLRSCGLQASGELIPRPAPCGGLRSSKSEAGRLEGRGPGEATPFFERLWTPRQPANLKSSHHMEMLASLMTGLHLAISAEMKSLS